MPSKQLSFDSSGNHALLHAVIVLTSLAAAPSLQAQDSLGSTTDVERFLGVAACSSSGCHGGAGRHQNQYFVWSALDYHSQRPYATLTTARSKQIAQALSISDPTHATRCTSCHAPWQEVPPALLAGKISVFEGVSCETCHGPAESWLRSHTRPDWTRADRVHAGLRDLKDLYVRANTCIACHQTLETPLEKAGHPELIFDLDGQAVSQPKHWREKEDWNGGQAWLVGQAAALREMSWQLSRDSAPSEKLLARWQGLLWLLQKLDGLDDSLPELKSVSLEPGSRNFARAREQSDALAKAAAALTWTSDLSKKALTSLARCGGDFQQPTAVPDILSRRAERLVLGLDRLTLSLPQFQSATPPDTALAKLFKLVQSLPDFDAAAFARALDQFSTTLTALAQNKG